MKLNFHLLHLLHWYCLVIVYINVLYASQWTFLFWGGGCVWYMVVALAYHPHEEKPYLNSSFQFTASFELHGESQGISPPSNGHHGCTPQMLNAAAGTSHLLPYQSTLFMQVLLCFLKIQQIRTCAAHFLWSIPPKLLCLTFMNPSVITNTLLLAELDHFSSSWQPFWKLRQQSCFTIWAARTISCLVCVWTRIELLINVGSLLFVRDSFMGESWWNQHVGSRWT